jgi:hypothetical protein
MADHAGREWRLIARSYSYDCILSVKGERATLPRNFCSKKRNTHFSFRTIWSRTKHGQKRKGMTWED